MLVAPFWSTQPWFPQLLELLIDHPRLLQPPKDLLQLNGRLDMVHPLHSKLALLVTIISGQPSKIQAYQQWLQPSFVMPGEREPNSNTTAHCIDGRVLSCKGNPSVTPINDVVEFLSSYADGGRFGVNTTARSALGNFIHVPGVPVLADHPLIQKVVKGAYNTRPPAPCYVVIWDTDILLQYLDSLDNACLNFKLLSCKTAILLTILSGERVSTIHAFRLSQLQLTTGMAVFNLGTTLLKHSRPGRSTPIVFHRYPHGRRLCPLQTIRDYVTQRTLLAPQIDNFFYHSPQALSSGFQGYLSQVGQGYAPFQ